MSQTHKAPKPGSTTGAPRWVKVSGIIVLVIVLLFVVAHLTGNGFGPGIHSMPTPQTAQQP